MRHLLKTNVDTFLCPSQHRTEMIPYVIRGLPWLNKTLRFFVNIFNQSTEVRNQLFWGFFWMNYIFFKKYKEVKLCSLLLWTQKKKKKDHIDWLGVIHLAEMFPNTCPLSITPTLLFHLQSVKSLWYRYKQGQVIELMLENEDKARINILLTSLDTCSRELLQQQQKKKIKKIENM